MRELDSQTLTAQSDVAGVRFRGSDGTKVARRVTFRLIALPLNHCHLFMAPEVGLEPTTLRLTGAYGGLHRFAPACIFVANNGLTSTPLARDRTEMHHSSIRTATKTATTIPFRCHS